MSTWKPAACAASWALCNPLPTRLRSSAVCTSSVVAGVVGAVVSVFGGASLEPSSPHAMSDRRAKALRSAVMAWRRMW